MWEKLVNLDKSVNCPPQFCDSKLSNNKHRYSIAVQDRVFKIKKNPYYHKKKKNTTATENLVAMAQELSAYQDPDSN